MYLKNIKKFLGNYENISKSRFIKILEWSNSPNFDEYKLEKDFLLTLILIKFKEKFPKLIFKGGTCLNKIYFPYFRLSEDLDFVLDNKDLGRTARKTLLKNYEKNFVEELGILGLNLREGRTKFDEHKLAMFDFEYKSVFDNSLQTIKIDISLKHNLQLKPTYGEIKSIFVDKILEENIFGKHTIKTMDLKEMLAEKIRASLTRTIPAIRDFFDIWYIKNFSNFDFEDKEFKNLINLKLKEVNYNYSLNSKNFELLKKQIQTDLKPVLNEDFEFNFEEIYYFVLNFKESLKNY